jgi:hypothetical protein
MSAFTGLNVRFAKAVRLLFLNLKNIQQPTSNIERPMVAARGFIGCWALDVRGSMFPIKK